MERFEKNSSEEKKGRYITKMGQIELNSIATPTATAVATGTVITATTTTPPRSTRATRLPATRAQRPTPRPT